MATIPLSRLFALVLLLRAGAGLAADIQVNVDRDPVQLDESFQIVFTATEDPDDDPDFGPLRRDFDIRSQDQSSQLAIANGKRSWQKEWRLTVMAKRAGDLTIPSVPFGKDRSPPMNLRVEAGSGPSTSQAGKQGELFMEVEVEPKNPYVQAQVLYTVRILSQVGLANARLEEPKLENAVMERVTEDNQYETRRNGQPYRAIERRFAIFPQQSGKLTIQPPLLEAEVQSGRSSMFNRFFSQQGDAVRLRGEAVELNVRPIPAQFSGKHWLPAKELALEETLTQPGTNATPRQTAAGEPLTRTLKLRALASTVGNLPELAAAAPPGLRAYPDQPALNEERTPKGLKASREEKIALIPAQAGSYTLPEIAIPWWNTETDREEIARVPARTLTVGAG
ncbi:BatD family protein, partial [Methylogaea oryzae]